MYPVRRHPSSRSKRTPRRDPPAEDTNPDDVDRVREEFASQVREAGEGFTDDLSCTTKDGREVPTGISGETLDPGGNGGPTRMIAMLRDISDRVERRREFEATVERVDRFAGVVSHDLQNTLSVVTESHPYAEGMFLIGFGF